jgi:hypothetical protein
MAMACCRFGNNESLLREMARPLAGEVVATVGTPVATQNRVYTLSSGIDRYSTRPLVGPR